MNLTNLTSQNFEEIFDKIVELKINEKEIKKFKQQQQKKND